MTFEQFSLSMRILLDLVEILQAERGQREVADYLWQAGIAVLINNLDSFKWDEREI